MVVAAVAPVEGRDKAPDGWEGRPPGRVVSVSARRVGIMSHTSSDNPAPQNSARNAARE